MTITPDPVDACAEAQRSVEVVGRLGELAAYAVEHRTAVYREALNMWSAPGTPDHIARGLVQSHLVRTAKPIERAAAAEVFPTWMLVIAATQAAVPGIVAMSWICGARDLGSLAPLCCAAGMTIEDARRQFQAGELTEESVRMLASLRGFPVAML